MAVISMVEFFDRSKLEYYNGIYFKRAIREIKSSFVKVSSLDPMNFPLND